MVGGVQNADVRQDIIDAKNIGLNGFALNYGTQHLHVPFSLSSP